MPAAVTVNFSRQAGGFSLLEILVTMLVVALALLGHITLQNRTIGEQQAAFFQSMADTYLNDMAERMAANSEAAVMQLVNGSLVAATPYNNGNSEDFVKVNPAAAKAKDCTGGVSCSGTELAAYDLATWQNNVGAVMPGAAFRIYNPDITQPRLVQITLAWTPNKDGEEVDLSDGCDVNSSSLSVQCRVLVKML